jgi:dihydrofolate synthase/folylpolyglutamate synthase
VASLLPAPVHLDDLLEPFSRRGVDLGLHRLREALREGGHPERQFTALQVAGTNGKGSICTMVHAILRQAGIHCATYRSPHLVSWCERIQIDDRWISPTSLRSDLARWQEIGRSHHLTPFELLTAAAFDRFRIEAVDLAVLEVGLGGRLDATTTHPDRPVLGFGAIGLDHREVLGDTVEAIAREKAGVMAPGSIAISGPQHPDVTEVLRREARQVGCELRWVNPLPHTTEGGPVLGLHGDPQRSNAAVAVAMVEALAERWSHPAGQDLTPGAIRAGLAAARWPGRMECRHWQGRPLLIDGAHNPPAAEALRLALDQLPAPWGPERQWRRKEMAAGHSAPEGRPGNGTESAGGLRRRWHRAGTGPLQLERGGAAGRPACVRWQA